MATVFNGTNEPGVFLHHSTPHVKSQAIKILLSVIFVFVRGNTFSQAKITNLRCEHLLSPVGVDAANPRFSWQLNDSANTSSQKSFKLIVGKDSLGVCRGRDGWRSGVTVSSSQLTNYGGPELATFTKYYWQVTVTNNRGKTIRSPVASFETGMMDAANWKGSWVTDAKDITLKPAGYFRKTFSLNKKIAGARMYVAVAGLYELFINGKKIGDRVLDPAYTRFDGRILYTTYDVTSALQAGKNAISVSLGNGWYNFQSDAVWYFDKAPWRGRPCICMDLRITYTNSTTETIHTDKSWRTHTGPIIFNSIYTGEHQDARLKIPDWNQINFVDTSWKKIIFCSAPSKNIVSQQMEPIRDCEEITVQDMRRFDDTNYVFNFGRNFSGISKITLHGDSGTIIKLKHGERLYASGHVDISNVNYHHRPKDDSDPFATDIYILKGDREETFQPHFNYKGFQYVEVSSSKPIALRKQSLTAYFIHSGVQKVGDVTCSNEMINKIWKATNNSYLSNLVGYPTDCPQREKNGWTGDAQIAVETGLYNFDAITVYEKWMADHRDEQQPNGILPSIVPSSGWGYEWGNGPDWTSTIAIIPWNIYMFYGDPTCLRDCYDNIKRYIDHINFLYPSGICPWGLGDWAPVRSEAPRELTSTCYYFADVTILANAAKLFHKTDDYKKYSALANKIKSAFNEKYFDQSKNIYGRGMQTELAVPLFWHLVPENKIQQVAASLAAKIAADTNKLDVGILGAKAILNALSENGYANLGYQLASSETYPSWGWWIKNGATTLYENWPVDQGNSSHNHIMFGEISAWLYKALGGMKVDPAHPGFKNILLEPHFVKGLDSFSCYHDGPYGRIISKWVRVGDTVRYDITIPANCTATLALNNKIQHLTSGHFNFTLKSTDE